MNMGNDPTQRRATCAIHGPGSIDNRREWILVAAIGALLCLAQPANAASCAVGIDGYACTTLVYPAAVSTFVGGVNNAGQVSGYYQAGTSGARHGFTYFQGNYSSLQDLPGASQSLAFGLNEAGAVAGYGEFSTHTDGFIRSGSSSLSPVAYPGAGITEAFDVNGGGQVVGIFAANSTAAFGSFLLSSGSYTILAVPGASATYAYGINDAGTIAGSYADATGNAHGFTLANGNYSTVDVPGAAQTFVRGLNGLGDVVGEYVDNLGKHGFARLGSGQFWKFDIVGAANTFAAAISDNRVIAGSFGTNDVRQGFLVIPVPVPLPATLPLLAAGLLALVKARRRPLASHA